MTTIINRKIPYKIFQTWETKTVSPRFQKIIDTWKQHNPHYEYYFHDSQDREDFIKRKFHSSVYRAYCKILPGAYKADLWRYCILYTYGGVYIDIDTLCLGGLDDFIKEETEFMATIDFNTNPEEGQHNIANGFIACMPNSSIMQSCIYKIVYNVENGIIPSAKLDFSGPGLLGMQTNIYLKRNEKESFIGLEGYHNEIHFLKFEEKTEYMKDINGNVLLQNKNGNQEIVRLYFEECNKANIVSWLRSPPIHKKKSIAFFLYGQFRSYKKNLENNLRILDFLLSTNDVHVFILSDKQLGSNYSPENEIEIKAIFQKAGCTVHYIKYIEDIPEYNKEKENEISQNYYNISNMESGADKFTASLLYRLHLANKIKNEYILKTGLKIDTHFYYRIFDTVISKNTSDDIICNTFEQIIHNPSTLYGSHDTFYIGNKESVDYMLNLGEHFAKTIIYKDEIWNDAGFTKHFIGIDCCLCSVKATYSSEAQRAAHIYYSNYIFHNIRFDYNIYTYYTLLSQQNSSFDYKKACDGIKEISKRSLFNIKLCDDRHNY